MTNQFCNEWKNNFSKIENDPSNIGGYTNYYKDPKGYYLDIKDSLYKKCYYSCERCDKKGNDLLHNCMICNNNFPVEININNSTNCYPKCNFYYYFDNESNYNCTNELSCPEGYYHPSILDKNECIKGDKKYESTHIIVVEYSTTELEKTFINKNTTEIIYNQIILYSTTEIQKNITMEDLSNLVQDIINLEKNDSKEITKEEEIELYNEVIKSVESLFTSDYYNTSNLDNGIEEVIQTEKMTITLTTTQNQKNSTNNNMTLLHLGECETLLRNHYNISENETIYMKKIDVKQEGMKIPKIEYRIYCKLNGSKLQKLNLSVCEDSKISLSTPIEITESLDKLNTSSRYFNDKCYKSTSESGTDISLKDRQKEFVEGNKTICQDDCDFSDYDKDIKKANCSCQVKDSSNSYEDMNINKTKLYENFDNAENKIDFSNLDITSCKVLGSKENIESNAGFFLLLIILAIFIIIFIIFCTRGYNSLENKIDEVIYKKFKNETKNKNNKTILNSNNKQNKYNNTILNSNNKHNNKILPNKRSKSRSKNNSKTCSLRQLNKSRGQIQNKNQIKRNNSKVIPTIRKNKNKNNNKINNNTTNNNIDTDYELNWLSYNEALKFDKRTKCDYYGALLKNKQLIIFTFCSFNDYNSGVVKKFMFFLSFALHYTVNALFFTESTMHQIYEDEGKFNFEYQISKIIFSAIISTLVLRLMLKFLVLTDKDVLEVKKQQTKLLANSMKKKKLKCMKIKFAIFFVLNFILLGLFWYYLTCFNAIYQNTQIYLIKNTFISFGFSLFYPFFINIFPTMLRNCSLHSKKKDQEYFYRVSQIIQVI